MELLHVTVREMEEKDLPAVLEVEDLCFKDKWSKENFLYELNENHRAIFKAMSSLFKQQKAILLRNMVADVQHI